MDESLTYEETPVIEPVAPAPTQPAPSEPPQSFQPVEPAQQFQPMPPPKSQPLVMPPRSISPIILIVLLLVIFIAGFWASSYIKQFFPGLTPPPPKQVVQAPTPTPTPIDPYAGWKTYFVISSITHKAIDGVSFKLPSDMADLICDGRGCVSQGTTMPGGTRFTVAARGAGQGLTDYRGKIITDASGKPFVTTATTVFDRPAVSFVGDFTGTTITGYSFTKMRGVMISVTDTMSLEVNHFTPTSNPNADFTSDDVLFAKIINSFVFAGLPTPSLPATTPAGTSAGTTKGL